MTIGELAAPITALTLAAVFLAFVILGLDPRIHSGRFQLPIRWTGASQDDRSAWLGRVEPCDRAGVWSLTVTKNWRMTFRINAAHAIEDMDLEDDH